MAKEIEVKEKVEVKEEDSGNINLLDQLRRWWNLQRHFENMPEEEVDYSKVEVEESEETKSDREKDREIIEYLEKLRKPMKFGGDTERKKTFGEKIFLDKMYDIAATFDPLLPKDYQEGVDWWNPHVVTPHGFLQNIQTQGDPLKNTPIRALHEFGKESSESFGVWAKQAEEIEREIAERKKKEKEEQAKRTLGYLSGRNTMNRGGLSGQAQDVANAGRYGDTMLMHVNPAEVQGLKSLGMPITTNPQTGQPEAFLPLIGALLGSMGVFGGVAPWLTGALGSGILSGVGSLLQGDDLKEAALTGLGSFALGKLGGALGKGSPDALKAGAQGGVEGLTTTLTDAGVDIGAEGIADIVANPVGKIGELSKLTKLDKGILQNALDVGTKSGIEEFAGKGLGAYGKEGTRIGPKLGDVKEGFSFGNLYEAGTSPDVFLPAAIGGGGLGAIKSQEDFERLMAEYQEDRKRRRAKAFADNPEQVPYGSQWGRILGVPPRPVSSGGRMGFFGGGLGSLGQIPQPLGGYTTPYADRPAINMPPYNENLVMGRG